jgi:hypothetical protein
VPVAPLGQGGGGWGLRHVDALRAFTHAPSTWRAMRRRPRSPTGRKGQPPAYFPTREGTSNTRRKLLLVGQQASALESDFHFEPAL